MKNIKSYLFLSLIILWGTACQKETIDIGGPPTNVSFSIEMIDGNNIRVTNTTPGVIPYWDFGNGTKGSGEVAEGYYPNMGDYVITLTVFGSGGRTSASQTVNIAENDPDACQDQILLFLTDCGTKTWKLKPDEGALWVGPNVNDPGNVWWQNGAGDVATRACTFDDEYIFSSDGTFEYRALGEVWAEAFWDGISSDGCVAEADLPASVAAWGSGIHSFALNSSPDQLTVNGDGAFIGLTKAANGAEVSVPQSTITYDIISMTSGTPFGDELVVAVNFGGGDWRMTIVSE
ncbi:MAG: PKD domain-containing protein [Bacteroidota bacterium]